MAKKIIITGITGMLGVEIANIFSENNYDIHGIARNQKKDYLFDENIKVEYFDMTNLDRTKKIIQNINPDIIIHCAANVNLNQCEANRVKANKINSEVPGEIATFIEEKTKFVYISTDSLFDGEKGDYKEKDEVYLLNNYAKSKHLGEEKVRKNHKNFIIIRTNIVGYHVPWSSSLFEWGLEKLINQNSIKGFKDAIFNPVTTKQLSKIIDILVEDINYQGIINIGSKKYISKYEFLLKIANEFGVEHSLIQPASIDLLNSSVQRPKNTTLNISKINNLLNDEKHLVLSRGISELKKDLFNKYIFNRRLKFE